MTDNLNNDNGQGTPSPAPSFKIPVTPTPTSGDAAPEVDALVRDYERKYQGFRDGEGAEVKDASGTYFSSHGEFKAKRAPSASLYSGTLTDQERTWAMLAEASVLVSLLIGIPTGGLATLVTLFIPLGIYFYFRDKSEFVAYHALQAFALQVLGTVGWVIALVVGALLAVLITVILAITIVGVLIIPFVWVAFLVFAVASLGMPIGMVAFGLYGAWEASQGKWYQVPYVGPWISRQTHGTGFLSHI
ncbi:MAG TPA: DUF4870 domain-containing protein [Aggregatilineales bacterium]|nr:DUF4870 domain-containing protein [Aggregatilineales bacterium]